jgi:YbgC/YbaW family acyl-CoA thioester hydrolase
MVSDRLPERADFRFLDRLRVRWAEVDMQKIVFNGHYLMYFDTAVAGYWRALALPYHDTMQRLQGDLYVRKATIEYEGSARYDDLCEAGVRCARIGKSSMVFTVALFRGETRLVHGELIYVFADPATQTSRPVPPALREVLEGFEAGQPMLECVSGTWDQLGRDARPLRKAVFESELGVAQAMAEDAADGSALHVVAYNRFGVPLGTGRLVSEGEPGEEGRGLARIGRVAVVGTLRQSGIGAAIVRALVQGARNRGDREVVLASQVSAARFYERLGFAPRGVRRGWGDAPGDGARALAQKLRLVAEACGLAQPSTRSNTSTLRSPTIQQERWCWPSFTRRRSSSASSAAPSPA